MNTEAKPSIEQLLGSEYGKFAEQVLAFYVPLALQLPHLRQNPELMQATVKATGQSGVSDVVTGADKYIQQKIKEKVAVVHPDWAFWGEEGEDNTSQTNVDKPFLVITDPIEGTNNFREGLDDQWGSVIALVDNKTKEPVVGIVAQPSKRRIYLGVKEQGAYCIHYNESNEIESTTLMSSEPEVGYEQFTYNASPHFSPELIQVVDAFLAMGNVLPDKTDASALERSRKTVEMTDPSGQIQTFVDPESGALEAVRNRGTIYFKTSNEMAAVFVIVGEIGGRVTDADGNPWSFGIHTLVSARTQVDYDYLKGIVDAVRK